MIIMAIIIIMVLVIIKIIMVITIIMTAIKACKKVRGFSGQVCPDDKPSTSGRIFIPITKPASVLYQQIQYLVGQAAIPV